MDWGRGVLLRVGILIHNRLWGRVGGGNGGRGLWEGRSAFLSKN
jgi:hypothetical protein